VSGESAGAPTDRSRGPQGSIGCGRGQEGGLSNELNTALGQSVDDLGSPIPKRRDLSRFCHYMTSLGAGWDNNSVITPGQDRQQRASFTPADFFGRTDVASSVISY
jgi:hypothetical protein